MKNLKYAGIAHNFRYFSQKIRRTMKINKRYRILIIPRTNHATEQGCVFLIFDFIYQKQVVDPDFNVGMALAFVIGPFIVAQAAINGHLQAFFYVAFDTVGGFSPSHKCEPLRIVHPLSVGIHTTFVNSKAKTRDFVVAKAFHFRFCTWRPINMTEFLIVLIVLFVYW